MDKSQWASLVASIEANAAAPNGQGAIRDAHGRRYIGSFGHNLNRDEIVRKLLTLMLPTAE
jgi:hypothetical protein